MTKEEAAKLILDGKVQIWNNYRELNPKWIPDLSSMDLTKAQFVIHRNAFNLSGANLCGAQLPITPAAYYEISPGGNPFRVDMKGALVNVDTATNVDLGGYGATFVSKFGSNLNPAQISVFISYAWVNEDAVLAIEQWLRIKGLTTRIDKRDFFAGARIRDEIMRVMSECNVILIFYSAASSGKPWPEFERELAGDIEMNAKKEGSTPPRVIYLVIDNTQLPSVTEKNRIAIMAKGKRFELVCEEIYHSILQIPRATDRIDLSKWSDYVF